jgi:hypothetical protein
MKKLILTAILTIIFASPSFSSTGYVIRDIKGYSQDVNLLSGRMSFIEDSIGGSQYVFDNSDEPMYKEPGKEWREIIKVSKEGSEMIRYIVMYGAESRILSIIPSKNIAYISYHRIVGDFAVSYIMVGSVTIVDNVEGFLKN